MPGLSLSLNSNHSRYQIQVTGWFSPSLIRELSGLEIYAEVGETSGTQITSLTVPACDQAALRGILNRLWDMNLSVISLVQMEVENRPEVNNECSADPSPG